jgi:putative endonuclease
MQRPSNRSTVSRPATSDCHPELAKDLTTFPRTSEMPYTTTQRQYFVYIMSSQTQVLYVGVTNNLELRVQQHKHGVGSAFTSRYRTRSLVFYEETSDVHAALAREREIKGWKRQRKIALIESDNPDWRDLSDDWSESSAVGL